MREKKIVVVGGASGIGLAIAKQAASEGASVVIASRSIEKLEAAAKSIPYPIAIEQVDATSDESVIAFFARVGAFDHLAVTIKPNLPSGKFIENKIDMVREAFDAKFWGQYRLAKYAIQHISPAGSIVLTSGIAAHRSYAGYSIVSAMNAATEALARAISVEASPIRINVVCPGFIGAEKSQIDRLKYAEGVGAKFPLARLGRTEEAASAYLFLFKNAYASGSCVVVDGATSC
jgi:NAD(P)-dependent dehydrogenase (short-subunit alcohol dehydrogenase family)